VTHPALRPAARGFAAAGLALALLAPATVPAAAQDPPDTVPPDARRIVRELVYRVETLASRIEDLRLKETDTEIRIELAADVLFDFDKATLRPEAERTLERAAGIVRDRASGAVRVEGHTDGKGTDAYNQRLSERRAEAVKTWLAAKGGIGAMTFATKGFGAKQPVAPNTKPDGSDDPDGRQRNRRVEIIIAKKE
jgi:outer membrane protein OmpA-like peptidoglycan-associated protein